mmetsp:Transcript_44009/g.171812  ORF Transcript_44009/g.171812 Transcript_44009/m.171812 type:complete len:84 (-) Transcript_44009:543-794(-)
MACLVVFCLVDELVCERGRNDFPVVQYTFVSSRIRSKTIFYLKTTSPSRARGQVSDCRGLGSGNVDFPLLLRFVYFNRAVASS